MNIGNRVTASSDFHDVTGIIVSGFELEGDNKTEIAGQAIDMDSDVTIMSDDGKTYRCHGWLYTFTAA